MTTERKLTMADCTDCFASRSKQTIIDVLHPNTGRTVCFGRTLEDVRKEYPDAEHMPVAAFCDWKAQQQRTPITWNEITAEHFDEMLNVLPPADHNASYTAFIVGEAYDHDAGNGQPRYQAFHTKGERYFQSSRPMTRAEFRAELQSSL
jgi:hypothetical protein